MQTPPRTSPRKTTLPSGLMVGEFRVVRLLGQGGMGQVYLARDVKLGRQVALKLLRTPKGVVKGRLRLLLEARTTAMFNHPNIVTIHTVGEYAGHPYLALEYLKGQTLAETIKKRGLGLSEMIRISVDISAALAEAHRHALLHLDLKPSNVFQCTDGRIKVLDFGLARPIDAEPSLEDTETAEPGSSGRRAGTPVYMAPHQWQRRPRSEATDMWAFGTMLFEMLAGQRPFSNFETGFSTLEEAVTSDTPPASLRSLTEVNIPTDLETLVMGCLSRDPQKRPSSKAAHRLLQDIQTTRRARRTETLDSPYRGLASFETEQAALFFGRDQEIAEILDQIRWGPIMTVAGGSGSGKSSLVHAGLIPRLMEQESWTVLSMRPGAEPIKTLTAHVLRGGGSGTTQSLQAQFLAHPEYLWRVLDELGRRRKSRILLVVDQFEELYTQNDDTEVQDTFLRALASVAGDAEEPHRVILTVRTDFLSRIAQAGAMARWVTRRIVLLRAPEREALKETLLRPAELMGYAFEDSDMVEEMVAAVENKITGLPLLQFTAQALWDKRDRTSQKLTRAAYTDIGGVTGAFARHAAHIVQTLGPAEEDLVRQLLLKLVTPERTRRTVVKDDALQGLPSSAGAILERLIHARIISVTKIRKDGASTPAIELTHEALIQNWDQLREWVDLSQEALRFRSRVQQAAQQWFQRNRSEGLLWRDDEAEDALRFVERYGPRSPVELDRASTEFLEAVITLHRRRQRRHKITRGSIGVGLLGLSMVLTMLTIRSQESAEKARTESRRARNATRMAIARENVADPTLVFSLVRELDPAAPPERWRDVARWAQQEGIARVTLEHPDAIWSASFSPNGNRIVTACDDNTARIYNADGTGTPIVFAGHSARVNSAAFSPDGTRIVTTSYDRTARVWTANNTSDPIIFNGHGDNVYFARFSPNGEQIVTASWDGTARVWSADGTGEPVILRGHQGRVFSAAFSPDGKRIVTASLDKTARVWPADGSGEPVVFEGHEKLVFSAAFSPDGKHIVTASFDKTARVWPADGRGTPIVLRKHLERLHSAVFSPDGTRIVTASEDRTAIIHDADGSGTPIVLKGHLAELYSAEFSPDGDRVVTASYDRTVRVWDVDRHSVPVILTGHRATVISAAFSPDGTRIVTASADKTARIHNADGTGEAIVLTGHRDRLHSAAFSPDGQRVVTASWDKTVRIYNADGTGAPDVFEGHLDRVYSASFSPDGKHIVSASADKTARIFDTVGNRQPIVFEGHHDRIYSVAFSPDGKHIVTASFDKTARIWNADGTGKTVVLKGHAHRVYSVAFSPDGKRIITGSHDKTARIWNADGTGTPIVLPGHEAAVVAGTRIGQGSFTPDGTQVITVSDDQTVRIWRIDGSSAPIVLRTPDLSSWSAAFSPDGTRIVTASHRIHVPATESQPERVEHAAKVWKQPQPIRNLDDPMLWKATTYCPSVKRRMKLLSLPEDVARKEYARCLRKVNAAL